MIIKLRGIGDIVISTVVIDNLKKDFPEAEIDYLVETGQQVVENLPEINEVIKGSRKTLRDKIDLIKKIRSKKYDLVIDFFANPFTAQLTFFSGARYRLGFPYRGRKYAYNLYGPSVRSKYHAVDLHLKTLELTGLSGAETALKFGLNKNDKDYAENFSSTAFPGKELVCVMLPGGGWASKRCEPAKLADVAAAVVKEFGAKVLLVWGPEDKADAEFIFDKLGNEVSILAPLTTIGQMAALIAKGDFAISNDSGPMHISTGVGTPVLGLYGPTDPSLQGPYGEKHEAIRYDELHCIGCNLLECPYDHECFKDLSTDKVILKVAGMLQKNGLLDK